MLLLITFRPEFQSPWGGRAHVSSLALNRLGERDGETMVRTLAGNAGLSPETIAEIVERTDGVPLFVEELTMAVLESAAQGDRVAGVLADDVACRAGGAGDLACLADGAARSARTGGQGDRADRRGARPRVCL